MVTADYHLNINMSSPVPFQSGNLFNQIQGDPSKFIFHKF